MANNKETNLEQRLAEPVIDICGFPYEYRGSVVAKGGNLKKLEEQYKWKQGEMHILDKQNTIMGFQKEGDRLPHYLYINYVKIIKLDKDGVELDTYGLEDRGRGVDINVLYHLKRLGYKGKTIKKKPRKQ